VLDAGAFSSDAVVKASEPLIRVLVDADGGDAIFQKHQVEAMPTLLFLDPDGKKVEQFVGVKPPEAVEGLLKTVAEKFGRKPRFHKAYDAALEQAKAESKPVAVFFYDAKPASAEYAKALDDKALEELFEKIVFVKVEVKKDAPEVKKYNVTAPPMIVVVNPGSEKPESSPVRKIYGKKAAKDVKKDLEEALKKFSTK
jgi:thiol:disulfide interchange protein